MPVSAVEFIAGIPGVRSAEARIWGVLPGPPAVTIIADATLADLPTEVTCGRGVSGAVVAELLAIRALDGSSLPARVKSLLGDGTDTLAFDVVYAPASLARRALLLDSSHATDVAVESIRPEEDDALVREIAARLGYPVRVVTRAQMRGAWQTRAGMTGTIRLLALSPALLTVLLLAVSLAMGGPESRQDAGKLKLAGWQTRHVAWLFALQSMSVCTASVGIGLVIAYVLVIPLGAGPLLGPFFGWTASLPQLTLDAGGAVQVLLLVGGIMMVPILGASFLPAWRVARIDPAELLEAP
jgi:ABC-type lipoprotein release transport system permease subunit